mmetsp:Transcript_8905/g.16206  ORF Transcript_8905/g.16206 Transcript_8905/m.16206 type:complete len:240 (-) Transcript_8905:921-1640(-)
MGVGERCRATTTLVVALWVFLMASQEFCAAAPATLSVTVWSGEEHCMNIRIPGSTPSIIAGTYESLDDELSSDLISLYLFAENDVEMWRSHQGSSGGSFRIATEDDWYKFCVQNGSLGHDDEEFEGDGSPRQVGFSLRVIERSRVLDHGGDYKSLVGQDREEMQALLERSQSVLEDLEDLIDHQAYVRHREAAHREVAEHTFGSIWKWTFAQILILMAVSASQVFYIRCVFERRRYQYK